MELIIRAVIRKGTLENKGIKGTYSYILSCIHNDSAFSEQGRSSTLIHLNALLKSTLIIAYWAKLLVDFVHSYIIAKWGIKIAYDMCTSYQKPKIYKHIEIELTGLVIRNVTIFRVNYCIDRNIPNGRITPANLPCPIYF